MLIERPQAVNTKCLEGKKTPASEIGQPGQTVSVIYGPSNLIEGTSYGGGKMDGVCEEISSFGARCEN